MIIDHVDLIILRYFCKLKKDDCFGTWTLMKKLYPKGKDLEHMRIRRKIEKMARNGLFSVNIETKEYTLHSNLVYIKKMKFKDKEVETICFSVDNKWCCYEI